AYRAVGAGAGGHHRAADGLLPPEQAAHGAVPGTLLNRPAAQPSRSARRTDRPVGASQSAKAAPVRHAEARNSKTPSGVVTGPLAARSAAMLPYQARSCAAVTLGPWTRTLGKTRPSRDATAVRGTDRGRCRSDRIPPAGFHVRGFAGSSPLTASAVRLS